MTGWLAGPATGCGVVETVTGSGSLTCHQMPEASTPASASTRCSASEGNGNGGSGSCDTGAVIVIAVGSRAAKATATCPVAVLTRPSTATNQPTAKSAP